MSAPLLRQVVAAISAMATDALFEFSPPGSKGEGDPGGIEVRTLDASHVCLLTLKIPPRSLYDFDCPSPASLPLPVEDMDKFLKLSSGYDVVEASHDSDGQHPTKLLLRYEGQGRPTKRFFLQASRMAVDAAPERPAVVKDHASVSISARPDVLSTIVADARTVSSQVRLTAAHGLLVAEAREIGGSETRTEFAAGDVHDLEVVVRGGKQSALYSLQYLQNMTKIVQASAGLCIAFSTDKPLVLEFDLIGGGTMEYALAPRLEPDFGPPPSVKREIQEASA